MFLLGPLRVDLGSLSVTDGRATTPLTRTEAALIERLLEAAGGVVSRDSLLADVWGYGPNIKTRTLITTLSRVRAKIEVDPAEPKHLLTERGQGVSLVGAEPVVRERAAASVALVGRREALEAVRQGLNAGPVLIAGAIGSGRSSLARAVAERWDGPTVVVDLQDASDLQAALAAHRSGLATSMEALLDGMGSGGLVVLDGAEPGKPTAAEVQLTAGRAAVLLTGAWTGAHTVLLGPLDARDAARVLQERAAREGVRLPEALVHRAVAATDRLPGELVLLAPQLALFGDIALDTALRDPARTVGAAVAGLDDGRRALAEALACFEATFDLEVAAAVSGLPLPEAAAGVLLLVQRGLCLREGGRFRLLRDLRELLRARAPAAVSRGRERFREWLVADPFRYLREGFVRSRAHRADILLAAHACPPEQCGALANALDGLASVPDPALVPALRALEAYAPQAAGIRLYSQLVSHGAASLTEEDRQLLEGLALAGDLRAAAVAWIMAEPGEDEERRLHAVLACEAPPEVAASQLPGVLGRYPPAVYDAHIGPIEAIVNERGWSWAAHYIEHSRRSCLLEHGHHVLVAGFEPPPGDDWIALLDRVFIAKARYLCGDLAGAREIVRTVDEAPFASFTLFKAIIAEPGELDEAALAHLAAHGRQRLTADGAAALLALHRGHRAEVRHPVVRAIVEGRPLEGRVGPTLRCLARHFERFSSH